MAEFNLFCTEKDLVTLLYEALENGCKVQWKIPLPTPSAKYCTSFDEISAAVLAGGHAFLLEHESFTKYPVSLLEYEREGMKYWTARAAEGGPVIEIHFFFPFVKNGVSVIPCSLISFLDRIENPATGEREMSGDAIKRYYAGFVKPIRKGSRRVSSGKRVAYVTNNADDMLKEGWHLATPYSG
ncbi:hypothetical protein [Duganella sp. Root1480D1]|uniref:hypothetical protein n=1 Tax=Duganella sp. Root1480D1 TaxID=1736471 RepID=UPI000AB196A2|nr:hypothetical protein [Duganella sp. Root1480D1]